MARVFTLIIYINEPQTRRGTPNPPKLKIIVNPRIRPRSHHCHQVVDQKTQWRSQKIDWEIKELLITWHHVRAGLPKVKNGTLIRPDLQNQKISHDLLQLSLLENRRPILVLRWRPEQQAKRQHFLTLKKILRELQRLRHQLHLGRRGRPYHRSLAPSEHRGLIQDAERLRGDSGREREDNHPGEQHDVFHEEKTNRTLRQARIRRDKKAMITFMNYNILTPKHPFWLTHVPSITP